MLNSSHLAIAYGAWASVSSVYPDRPFILKRRIEFQLIPLNRGNSHSAGRKLRSFYRTPKVHQRLSMDPIRNTVQSTLFLPLHSSLMFSYTKKKVRVYDLSHVRCVAYLYLNFLLHYTKNGYKILILLSSHLLQACFLLG
jgi:hypothetical protein